MAKKTASDAFLSECEPYFLDAVHTIGQIAQRTSAIVREAVDRHLDSLVEALGFTEDEIALLDYWDPDKLQKTKPTDGISIGVKFKVSDLFEAAIYRYWIVEEKATGIEAWTWIKGRARLDRLSKALDDADAFPEPNAPWDSSTSSTGTYFLTRELEGSEIADFDLQLDEFITYYINLATKGRRGEALPVSLIQLEPQGESRQGLGSLGGPFGREKPSRYAALSAVYALAD